MKNVEISGLIVQTTDDSQIMVAQSIPGKIDLFFKPFNFYPESEELKRRVEDANMRHVACMACDLSNKGRGIIHLEYNPLSDTAETAGKIIEEVINYIYECKRAEVDDDEV